MDTNTGYGAVLCLQDAKWQDWKLWCAHPWLYSISFQPRMESPCWLWQQMDTFSHREPLNQYSINQSQYRHGLAGVHTPLASHETLPLALLSISSWYAKNVMFMFLSFGGIRNIFTCNSTKNNEVEIAWNRNTARNSPAYKCVYTHCRFVFLFINTLCQWSTCRLKTNCNLGKLEIEVRKK